MVVAASCCGDVLQRQELGEMNAAMYTLSTHVDILDENLFQSAVDLRLGQRFIF
ncbi:hypothetical protein EXN66_Car017485 [Channa argus]|uniref:Uncharacterized protein n=1 Tax=Channa argus TaxID=215402 RepID=A0A6G1QH54_CHAAH|nr:hypothetical protein EXN66_Car017485 [Channa argus]